MGKSKGADEPPLRFEDAVCELEAIARELEEGAIGLDESLRRFEQAVGLLRHCYEVLDAAERKINLLTGFDGDGNPVLEPFDATATAEQGSAGRRKARRESPRAAEGGGSDDCPPEKRGLF